MFFGVRQIFRRIGQDNYCCCCEPCSGFFCMKLDNGAANLWCITITNNNAASVFTQGVRARNKFTVNAM